MQPSPADITAFEEKTAPRFVARRVVHVSKLFGFFQDVPRADASPPLFIVRPFRGKAGCGALRSAAAWCPAALSLPPSCGPTRSHVHSTASRMFGTSSGCRLSPGGGTVTGRGRTRARQCGRRDYGKDVSRAAGWECPEEMSSQHRTYANEPGCGPLP